MRLKDELNDAARRGPPDWLALLVIVAAVVTVAMIAVDWIIKAGW